MNLPPEIFNLITEFGDTALNIVNKTIYNIYHNNGYRRYLGLISKYNFSINFRGDGSEDNIWNYRCYNLLQYVKYRKIMEKYENLIPMEYDIDYDWKSKIIKIEYPDFAKFAECDDSYIMLRQYCIQNIPEEIANSSLIELDLANNCINDVPINIGECPNLEVLNLSNNWISATPPGNYSKLKKLNLKLNFISEINIQTYTSLVKCNLEHNDIAILPSELSNLINLKILKCSDNKVTNWKSICSLINLETCDLNYNEITYIPSDIFKLRNLIVLSLGNNKITKLNENFSKLNKLQKVILCCNKIESFPSQLHRLKNLEYIDLVFNKISKITRRIKKLKKLYFLDLTHNNLETVPREIWKLSRLQHLKLNNNLISDMPRNITGLNVTVDLSFNIPKSYPNPETTIFINKSYHLYIVVVIIIIIIIII